MFKMPVIVCFLFIYIYIYIRCSRCQSLFVFFSNPYLLILHVQGGQKAINKANISQI